MTALTEWYPPEIKPVRVGWYQRMYVTPSGTELPDYWSGTEWLTGLGVDFPAVGGAEQNRFWRGLANDPGGGAK